MKFYTTLLFALVFLIAGCKTETCTEEKGLTTMDEYLATNNLMPEDGEAGMRYIILEPGGVEKPNLNSFVTIRYVGMQTNDEIFDQTPGTDTRRFLLRNLIGGWQLGLPLIGAGGKIQLFLPSSLAYGSGGSGDICPNSELIFEIELVSFNE